MLVPDTIETQKWLVKCTANIEDSYQFSSYQFSLFDMAASHSRAYS